MAGRKVYRLNVCIAAAAGFLLRCRILQIFFRVSIVLLQVVWFLMVFVGRRGSVVACATYKREIAGSIPGCAEYASTLCSYGQASSLWQDQTVLPYLALGKEPAKSRLGHCDLDSSQLINCQCEMPHHNYLFMIIFLSSVLLF